MENPVIIKERNIYILTHEPDKFISLKKERFSTPFGICNLRIVDIEDLNISIGERTDDDFYLLHLNKSEDSEWFLKQMNINNDNYLRIKYSVSKKAIKLRQYIRDSILSFFRIESEENNYTISMSYILALIGNDKIDEESR